MKKMISILLFISCFATNTFSREWGEIKKSGVLKVGLRTSAQIVYRPNDKTNSGMMYDMVRDFAALHNLKLEPVIVPSFSEYWKSGNKNLNKSKEIKTPDIYKKIDLAAEIFTVTARRNQLVKLTPYIDNVELFFGIKGNKVLRNYNELIGKSLFTYESMSFHKIIVSQLESRKLPYKRIYVTPNQGKILIPKEMQLNKDQVNLFLIPSGTKVDGTLSYQPIADGEVDVGINDGLAVMIRVFGNSYYRKNIRPLFPASRNKSKLAWASRHEDTILNQKIQEFIDEDRRSGHFSKRLGKYIGMSLDEYEQLINMIE